MHGFTIGFGRTKWGQVSRRWCMDRLIPRLSDRSPWELRTSFMPPELPKGSQRRRRDSASQRHALLDMIFKALKSGR